MELSSQETATFGQGSFGGYNGVHEREKGEGKITKSIESVTSSLPSGAYLTLALASMGVSATLQIMGKQKASLFVGQWAPTILIMGLYNKLVKLEGSE